MDRFEDDVFQSQRHNLIFMYENLNIKLEPTFIVLVPFLGMIDLQMCSTITLYDLPKPQITNIGY